MPLPVLLGLGVFGIAGVALMLHLLGYSTPARLADAAQARQVWSDRYPDFQIERIVLAGDGSGALIVGPRGPGVIWAVGGDLVARPLHAERIEVTETEFGLRLSTGDLTAPMVSVSLTVAERELWRRDLQGAAA